MGSLLLEQENRPVVKIITHKMAATDMDLPYALAKVFMMLVLKCNQICKQNVVVA